MQHSEWLLLSQNLLRGPAPRRALTCCFLRSSSSCRRRCSSAASSGPGSCFFCAKPCSGGMLLGRAVGVDAPLPPLLRAASKGCGGSACSVRCPFVGVLSPSAVLCPFKVGVLVPDDERLPLPLSAWLGLGSSSVPAVPGRRFPGRGGSRLLIPPHDDVHPSLMPFFPRS